MAGPSDEFLTGTERPLGPFTQLAGAHFFSGRRALAPSHWRPMPDPAKPSSSADECQVLERTDDDAGAHLVGQLFGWNLTVRVWFAWIVV
jgi:hypothetical protein